MNQNDISLVVQRKGQNVQSQLSHESPHDDPLHIYIHYVASFCLWRHAPTWAFWDTFHALVASTFDTYIHFDVPQQRQRAFFNRSSIHLIFGSSDLNPTTSASLSHLAVGFPVWPLLDGSLLEETGARLR